MVNKYYEKFKRNMKENWLFLVCVIAIVLLFLIELPYVIYTPGGAINLNDRITVEDAYPEEGTLSMAYVSMIRGNIPFLLFSYLIPNWDIVSTKEIKPANETLDEMIIADQLSLKQAQNNALYAAFTLANKEIKKLSESHFINYISEEAETDLELFDELLEINGQKIKSLDTIKESVQKLKPGDTVSFLVKRKEETLQKNAKVYQTNDGLKVGVSIITNYEYETNPKVEMKSKDSESGPSGGLMTALSIYNAITESDITRGRNIIGTGTIDQNGTVGEIGGVKYKLLGAVKKKADIFLVPEGNYEEAIKVKNEENLEIRIISVKTLKEAIQELKK